MLQWRTLISLLLAFFVVSAHAENMCIDLFPLSPIKRKTLARVHVVATSTPAAELTVKTQALSQDPDVAMQDVLFHLASTRDLSLSQKTFLKNGELHLGYDLGEGYKFEVTYRASDPVLVIKRGIIITPSNREKVVFENFLQLNQVRPQEIESFDLANIYPDFKKITVGVPLVIEANVIAKLIEFSPRFDYITKEELRKLVSENHIVNLTETAQKRFIKHKFLHYWNLAKYKAIVKVPFQLIKNGIGLMFFAIISTTNVAHDIKEFFVPDQKVWVSQSLERLESAMPTSVKAEVIAIENLTATAIKSKAQPDIKNNLDGVKFKVSATQYAWITKGTDKATGAEQSFFVVSQDNKKGQIQYFAVQFDFNKFPNLVKYFNQTGRLISEKNE